MAGKRKFQLTEQQGQELKAAFRESADGETRRRLQGVRLYGTGYRVKDVREITGCSRRSLLRWCQKYRLEGIADLVDQRQGGNRAILTAAQVEDVAAKLRQYLPVDVLGTASVATARGQTPIARVHPGREKVSFYGTLNLHTGQEVVTQEPTMNGEATARHRVKVLETHPQVPILLLWDKASWHGGPAAVRAVLEANPRLELMRFPTAARELNPQEMVWKATRTAISHNHDERQLASLAARFEHHLSSTTFCYSMLEKYDHAHICAMFN